MHVRVDRELSVGWRVFKKDPPNLAATLIAKLVFRLRNGTLEFWPDNEVTVSGELYDDDDPLKCLRYETDFAPFSLRADLMLVGTAYAPKGQPAVSFPIRWRVGAFSKRLRVSGRRTIQHGAAGVTVSDAEPLVQLPMSYAYAFGGPGYRFNPLGRGHNTELAPQIVDHNGQPGQPVGRVVPAGFGPIATTWEPRLSQLALTTTNT